MQAKRVQSELWSWQPTLGSNNEAGCKLFLQVIYRAFAEAAARVLCQEYDSGYACVFAVIVCCTSVLRQHLVYCAGSVM